MRDAEHLAQQAPLVRRRSHQSRDITSTLRFFRRRLSQRRARRTGLRPRGGDCQHSGMTGSNESPASVAAAYFDAWKNNDIERVRPLLHEDVVFDGALGSTRGAEETIAGLGRMFAMTKHVEVLHRWVDGADVLTWFELHTATVGPLAIANWSHVEAGVITRIRVTFDPRPLLR
jgi:limonene-1,2-epoxide hydrolase